MAKKKGKGGAKSAAGADSSSPSAPAPDVDNATTLTAEASDVASPEPSSLDPAPSVEAQSEAVVVPTANTSSDTDVEDLRRELAAYKAQITELQAQNAALDEENQRLKSTQSSAVPQPAPTVEAGRQPDLEALTQRIANLKAEQADADAAREAAWSQLKSVVADIARLAAPDAVMKAVGTPTAASAAGFGAA